MLDTNSLSYRQLQIALRWIDLNVRPVHTKLNACRAILRKELWWALHYSPLVEEDVEIVLGLKPSPSQLEAQQEQEQEQLELNQEWETLAKEQEQVPTTTATPQVDTLEALEATEVEIEKGYWVHTGDNMPHGEYRTLKEAQEAVPYYLGIYGKAVIRGRSGREYQPIQEYRCTRNLPYSRPGCYGHSDLSAREGKYVWASSHDEALAIIAQQYPQDLTPGVPTRSLFTVDLVKKSPVKHNPVQTEMRYPATDRIALKVHYPARGRYKWLLTSSPKELLEHCMMGLTQLSCALVDRHISQSGLQRLAKYNASIQEEVVARAVSLN